MKIIPKWLAKILLFSGLFGYVFKVYMKYHQFSIQQVLDKLTDNEELKAVLSYPAVGYLGMLCDIYKFISVILRRNFKIYLFTNVKIVFAIGGVTVFLFCFLFFLFLFLFC